VKATIHGEGGAQIMDKPAKNSEFEEGAGIEFDDEL
jgi:hypothetical protein